MTSTEKNHSIRTPDERAYVHERLVSEGHEWASGMPDYTTISREATLGKFESVYKAVDGETDADKDALQAAYDQSVEFVHKAFDFYEGKLSLDTKIDRAFIVPMRSNRQDEAFASESVPFTPLLDPDRNAVDSDIRMRTLYGLPPLILDTYLRDQNPRMKGAIVLAPVFEEMKTDYFTDSEDETIQTNELMRAARDVETIMGRTAAFAHNYLGAKVLGLGATLPGITNFGDMIRKFDGMQDVITTTGHGGTVYTIVETARKLIETSSIDSKGLIGVIGGAGSIGWSSTAACIEMLGDHDIVTYDTKEEHGKLTERVEHPENAQYRDRIDIARSNREVLERTNVIVTAIIGTIDLNDPEYAGLDLTGKVIIDDSQPGCFSREQVEARGGKLVWVVGEDGSETEFMTRDGFNTGGVPYNYGENSGLWGAKSEFACGQEAAVIAAYDARDYAVTDRVTPRNVRLTGELFKRAGVRVAHPYQAFGKPVEIN